MSTTTDPRAGFTVRSTARMTDTDPAFRVPQRPRLLPGLVQVALPTGLVVEGAEERHVFRGSAASRYLPALLDALECPAGCHPAELAHRLALPVDQVNGALSLLYANGLLDDAPDPPAATKAAAGGTGAGTGAEATRVWVARHLDTSRLQRSREGSWRALAATSVRVLGPDTAVTALAAALTDHGLSVVSDADAALTVVIGVEHDDRTLLRQVDAEASAADADWLRVLITAEEVSLGPLLGPDEGRCLSCLALAGQLQEAADDSTGSVTAGGDAIPAAVLSLGLALAATQVVELVSGSGRPLVLSGVFVLDLPSWRHTIHSTPRVPGCPDCSPAAEPDDAAPAPLLSVAHAFDAAVRFPAYRRQRPKDHQQHYARKNLALQQDERPHRTDLAGLPAPVFAGAGPTEAAGAVPVMCGGRLDLATLAVLLHRGVGRFDVLGGEARRCVPSGGNIGSAGAHVAVREVAGLATGVYRYEPREHGLLRLAAAPLTPTDLAALGADPAAGAVVVLTGDVEHVARKYVEFAYRVVHLDAGVVLAQLWLAARSRGVDCRPAPVPDEEGWAGLLGLDPDQTPVTAVVNLTVPPMAATCFQESR